MPLYWRVVQRAVLMVLLFCVASVAQDRSASVSNQGSPDRSPSAKKTPSSKARRRRTGSDDAATSATGDASAPAAPKTELATFGAGCFWHVEDAFEHLKGVKSAVSGYSGGFVAYPSYEMVHTGETGHAECVQVEYDPSVISFDQLLRVFWSCHDPTSINRQGEDEGPQYRSVIFYHSDTQRKAALKSYEQLTRARVFRLPIVTQLVPMQAFYPAEDYHQNYYSGLRRTISRRRKTASPKAKVVQRKSANVSRTTQKPPSTATPAKRSASTASPAKAGAQNDGSASRDTSNRPAENGPPR